MKNLVYLLLRRMRLPLIVVVLAYAVSILGMVLICAAFVAEDLTGLVLSLL